MGVTKKVLHEGDGTNYPAKGDLLTMVCTIFLNMLYNSFGIFVSSRMTRFSHDCVFFLSNAALCWNSGVEW